MKATKCQNCGTYVMNEPSNLQICPACYKLLYPINKYGYTTPCFDPRLPILRDAKLITVHTKRNVPSIRGCIRCGLLIEHAGACNNMSCKNCKCTFCFICLILGHCSGSCNIAPVQSSLPTANYNFE